MAEIATIDYKLGQDNVQVFDLDIHNPVFVWMKILRSVEAREDAGGPVWVAVEGYTDDQIGFHVKLLVEGGLLEGEDRGGDGDRGYSCYYPWCLTNDGYNFLEAANNDKLWNKAKAKIEENGLSMSLDILKKLLLPTL